MSVGYFQLELSRHSPQIHRIALTVLPGGIGGKNGKACIFLESIGGACCPLSEEKSQEEHSEGLSGNPIKLKTSMKF